MSYNPQRFLYRKPVFWSAVLVAVLILLLPISDSLGASVNYFDKIVHVLMFAGLTGLALGIWPRCFWSIALGLLAFAGCTEIAQGLTGWRTASVGDFLADSVGVFLVGLCRFFYQASQCRSQ